MRKVSKKRAKQLRHYSTVRREYLRQNPTCALCGVEATEVHHKRGRVGVDLINKDYFLAVCRECHQLIELNPTWARKLGYSISRLSVVDVNK
jgi:5-methylcytosine-specific restriction endonuclease McrA